MTVASGNVGEITRYPVALESGTNHGQFHHPEDMVVFTFLAHHVDEPVDTVHISEELEELAVSEDTVGSILDEMDVEFRDRVEDPFHTFLQDRVAQATIDLDPGDPWRPGLVDFHMIVGNGVRVVHLNDPENDRVPYVENGASGGVQTVVDFYRQHDTASWNRATKLRTGKITAALDWLVDAL